MHKLLILNFHKVVKNEMDAKKYTLSLSKLEEIIIKIKKSNLAITTIKDWQQNSTAKSSVAFTFDDGNKSDLDLVLPLLRKHNIKAYFFFVENRVDQPNYLSLKDLEYIKTQNHGIGFHSKTHRSLVHLTNLKFKQEVLSKKFNSHFFAFPFGKYTKKQIKILNQIGYSYLLTTQKRLNIDKSALIYHRVNIKQSTTNGTLEKIINFKSLYWKIMPKISKLKYQLTNRF